MPVRYEVESCEMNLTRVGLKFEEPSVPLHTSNRVVDTLCNRNSSDSSSAVTQTDQDLSTPAVTLPGWLLPDIHFLSLGLWSFV